MLERVNKAQYIKSQEKLKRQSEQLQTEAQNSLSKLEVELEDKIDAFKRRKQEQLEFHREELAKISDVKKAIYQKKSRELNDLAVQHQNVVYEMNEKHKERVESLEQTHRAEYEALEEENRQLIKSIQAQNRRLKENLAAIEGERAKLNLTPRSTDRGGYPRGAARTSRAAALDASGEDIKVKTSSTGIEIVVPKGLDQTEQPSLKIHPNKIVLGIQSQNSNDLENGTEKISNKSYWTQRREIRPPFELNPNASLKTETDQAITFWVPKILEK